MTMCLVLDDMVMKRARMKRIEKNTRLITKCVLWTGLGVAIATGTIGIKLLGEVVIIGAANKGTKWIMKNRKKLINKTIIKKELSNA